MCVFDLNRQDPGFVRVIYVIGGNPEITPDPVIFLLYRYRIYSSYIFSTESAPEEGSPFMNSKPAVSIPGSVHRNVR